MATTKEFNEQFDLMQKEVNKLREAEGLAEALGFDANYCDGICSNEEYEFRHKEITKLVGYPWPDSVQKAYNEGARQGYWET